MCTHTCTKSHLVGNDPCIHVYPSPGLVVGTVVMGIPTLGVGVGIILESTMVGVTLSSSMVGVALSNAMVGVALSTAMVGATLTSGMVGVALSSGTVDVGDKVDNSTGVEAGREEEGVASTAETGRL